MKLEEANMDKIFISVIIFFEICVLMYAIGNEMIWNPSLSKIYRDSKLPQNFHPQIVNFLSASTFRILLGRIFNEKYTV